MSDDAPNGADAPSDHDLLSPPPLAPAAEREPGAALSEHERTEVALRESRAMLQLVLDHVPQGVFWKDRDGRFLGTNAVAARATGFAHPDDVVGLTDYDLPGVTPEQAAFFQRKDREVMASGIPALGIEEPLGHADGTTSWLRTNKVPLRDAAGRVVGVLGTWEDVTERRRTEEALRASAAAFRHLADAMPQLVWTAHPDGTVDYYNEQAAGYDGLRRRASGTWEWAPILHSDDANRTAEAWRHAVASGEPYEVEHRLRMADGAYRWHVSRAQPYHDERGAVVRWYGTATDVHEMKRTEEALRASERELSLVLSTAPAAIARFDRACRYRYVNRPYVDRFGMVPDDVIGKHLREVLGDGAFRAVEAHVTEVLTGRAVEFEAEVELPTYEGQRYMYARYEPDVDAGGAVIGFIAVVTDVTTRKEAERALRELNQTLEERVEERTRQVTDLARALALAEQDERRRIARILHDDLQQVLFGAQVALSLGQTEQLEAVLGEAMEVTRTLSHGLSPPFLEGEDVEDLLRWVAERHQLQHGLQVEVEAAGDVPVPDPALRVLLYQVVRELLFNVAKHAGTARARVVVDRSDSHLRLCVEDQGAGFDPATLEQADGMGLSNARERIKLVGGRLSVESAPGEGARITVTVPTEETGKA